MFSRYYQVSKGELLKLTDMEYKYDPNIKVLQIPLRNSNLQGMNIQNSGMQEFDNGISWIPIVAGILVIGALVGKKS